jgi:hypothetical protein
LEGRGGGGEAQGVADSKKIYYLAAVESNQFEAFLQLTHLANRKSALLANVGRHERGQEGNAKNVSQVWAEKVFVSGHSVWSILFVFF